MKLVEEHVNEIVPAAQSAGAGEFQSFWEQLQERIAIRETHARAKDLVTPRNLTDAPTTNTI